jgi:hypothetical protein
MKKSTVGILAAVAAIGFSQAAEAQICAGFPASERGFYFGARVDFPAGFDNSIGVEAAYNAAGPLSVFGGLNVLAHDDDGETHRDNQFRVGAAFELPALAAMMGPRVSTCPTVEARWISDHGATFMEIPVGLGIGIDLGTPAGPAIGAYVQPQLVIARFSAEGIDAVTETNFGVTGGAMVGFGMFRVGGEIRHIFETGFDPVFGIRFGISL